MTEGGKTVALFFETGRLVVNHSIKSRQSPWQGTTFRPQL